MHSFTRGSDATDKDYIKYETYIYKLIHNDAGGRHAVVRRRTSGLQTGCQ